MVEDVERDSVVERRPWRPAALHARWRTRVIPKPWMLNGGEEVYQILKVTIWFVVTSQEFVTVVVEPTIWLFFGGFFC